MPLTALDKYRKLAQNRLFKTCHRIMGVTGFDMVGLT